MEKQREACPWCQKDVWVDPGRRRTYRCASCGRNFTFSPSMISADAPPSSDGAEKPEAAQSARGELGSARTGFVETPFVKELVERALAYLREGLAVHLSGPAGGGKTALALHLARQLGHQVVLIHGDDEFGTSDLVGKESGMKKTFIRDQYIHTVLKIDEESRPMWVDKALAEACRNGHTLVYDEFTRSRPEANNVLLSVLEERVLPMKGGPISVHPEFRAIFTSNPAEYAGVHGAQDALLDRMVTIRMDGLDRDTEVAITHAASELPQEDVEHIVDLVRAFRAMGLKTSASSVRPAIMIARILKIRSGRATSDDPIFIQTCRDVLLAEARRTGLDPAKEGQSDDFLLSLARQICSAPLSSQEHPETTPA